MSWAANGFAQNEIIPADPGLRTGKLSNGLTYYIRHNNQPQNRADFYLVQKVGSVLEEENQRGLAHFLEHMAFNGTKNFPGNSMTSELEKKGVRFGADINASTDYDQTIYRLTDIPSDRYGMIDTALLVLHDWSGFLTLDEAKIDQERRVVQEEWRTRNSGRLRVLENGILPVIFKGTPYANRIPIGSMDVINNFKPQQLRDYYKKWYRPDLQAIIIVGDIDADVVLSHLKKIFADIPAAENPAKRPWFTIPDNKEPIVAIASDPEIQEISMDVYWKIDTLGNQQVTTRYKNELINRIISNLLLGRYAEIRKKGDLPFSSVIFMEDNFLIATTRQAFALKVFPIDNNNALNALRVALKEIERVRRFGFNAEELENYKKGMLRLTEMEQADSSSKRNSEYISEYIQSFLKNEPVPDAAWKRGITQKLLSELSIDTLNQHVKQLLGNNNMAFVVSGPQRTGVKLPSATEILNVWDEVKKTKLMPYYLPVMSKENELMHLNATPGKIIKTEEAPYGYIQWTLSNGAKVQFKNTGYKENKFFLYGYSPGGLSMVKIEDLPSALALQGIINMGGTGDPEGNATVMAYLNKFEETIAGKTNNIKDLKTLFQLTYLKMTSFKKQPLVFEEYIKERKAAIGNHSSEPKNIFSDTLREIMSNHHPRAIRLDDTATLKKVDYDRIVRIYNERFGDASDFTFFLAGNIPADSVRPLVEAWLGALPSRYKKEKVIDHGIYPPKGIVKKHFQIPMKTAQSTVTIGYTGEVPLNVENQILMECLADILTTTYLEKMRKEEGGTYGAGVSGNIDKSPTDRFIFQVYFDTNPQKKDRLIDIVYEEIEKIRKEGPSEELLNKVKENLLKRYRESYLDKNAEYWVNKAWMRFVYGIDGDADYEKMVSSITPGMISRFAEKIFSQGNLIEVVMDPAVK